MNVSEILKLISVEKHLTDKQENVGVFLKGLHKDTIWPQNG